MNLFSNYNEIPDPEEKLLSASYAVIRNLDVWGEGPNVIDLSSKFELAFLNRTISQFIISKDQSVLNAQIERILTSPYEGIEPPHPDMLHLVYELQLYLSEVTNNGPPNAQEYLKFTYGAYQDGDSPQSESLNIREYSVDISTDRAFLQGLDIGLTRVHSLREGEPLPFYAPQVALESELQQLIRAHLNLPASVDPSRLHQLLRFSDTCKDQVLAYIRNNPVAGFIPFSGCIGNYLYYHAIAVNTPFLTPESIIVDPTILQVSYYNPFLRGARHDIVLSTVRELFPSSFDEYGVFIGHWDTFLHLIHTLGLVDHEIEPMNKIKGLAMEYENGLISVKS